MIEILTNPNIFNLELEFTHKDKKKKFKLRKIKQKIYFPHTEIFAYDNKFNNNKYIDTYRENFKNIILNYKILRVSLLCGHNSISTTNIRKYNQIEILNHKLYISKLPIVYELTDNIIINKDNIIRYNLKNTKSLTLENKITFNKYITKDKYNDLPF